jgi:hypothetical protein
VHFRSSRIGETDFNTFIGQCREQAFGSVQTPPLFVPLLADAGHRLIVLI